MGAIKKSVSTFVVAGGVEFVMVITVPANSNIFSFDSHIIVLISHNTNHAPPRYVDNCY